MNDEVKKPSYLGDGVYAKLDGGMIELFVDNGPLGSHTIYLELEVFLSLVAFGKKAFNLKVEK